MKQIKFLKNWNKKLDCDYFTTIRLYDNLSVQEEVEILLTGQVYRTGIVLKKSYFTIQNLPEMTAYLDAGLSKEELTKWMKQMYKNKVEDWCNQQFVIYLIGPTNEQ